MSVSIFLAPISKSGRKKFASSEKSITFAIPFRKDGQVHKKCGNSSVGRAQPCQGWGREFESRFPLREGDTFDDASPSFFCTTSLDSNSRPAPEGLSGECLTGGLRRRQTPACRSSSLVFRSKKVIRSTTHHLYFFCTTSPLELAPFRSDCRRLRAVKSPQDCFTIRLRPLRLPSAARCEKSSGLFH